MSSLSPEKILNLNHLCCPLCRDTLYLPDSERSEELRCAGCANFYPVVNGIPSLLPENEKVTEDIQRFWGALYQDAYKNHDGLLDREKFLSPARGESPEAVKEEPAAAADPPEEAEPEPLRENPPVDWRKYFK